MLRPYKKITIFFLLIGSLIFNGCQSSQEKVALDVKPVVDSMSSSGSNNHETLVADKNTAPKVDKSNDSYASFKPPSGVEIKIFNNKTYGYTMALPKSWGTIYDYSGYADKINDEWQTIGPYVPYKNPYITSEVFSDTNTTRKKNQSWLDFYIKERLEGQKYQISDLDAATYPTKVINLLDDKKNYIKTCLLLEHTNLYVFCFDPENRIAMDMVNSIRFDN